MADIKKLLAEIGQGRHDDKLADLVVAVRMRATAQAIAYLWRIQWDDLTVTEEDVTLEEMATAERIAGRNWSQLNPSMSGGNCLAILTAALIHRQGMSERDARKKAGALPAHTAIDLVDEYAVSPAPLEGSEDGSITGS